MATVALGKRHSFTLKEKYNILLYMEEHPEMTKTDVATFFAMLRTTLSGILAKAVEIKTLYNESTLSSTARQWRKPSFDNVDTALLQWFGHIRSSQPDLCVNGDMLLSKANEFAS